MTKTIKLPENMTRNDIWLALIAAANHAENAGFTSLAKQRREQAHAIDELNDNAGSDFDPRNEDEDDERDEDEVACYLKQDELTATLWAIGRVTFGDLEDAIDVRAVHSAYRELDEITNRI